MDILGRDDVEIEVCRTVNHFDYEVSDDSIIFSVNQWEAQSIQLEGFAWETNLSISVPHLY